jgi:hypothetical protein
MLTNIPDNTPIYMLSPKCTYRGAPEPQRLEALLLHQTRDGPRFSRTLDTPERPCRHYIHLQHLVNYYKKYVSPVSGYAEANPLEFLFIAEEGAHKDRSLAALEVDRLEGKDWDENYNCEDCAPRACVCCPCCEFYEEEAALPTVAPPPPQLKPVQLDVAAVMARLQSIEEKVTQSLAYQAMLERMESMKPKEWK